MGDIYAAAEKLVVWLVEEDWNSNVVAVFLEKFIPKLEDLRKSEGRNRDYSHTLSDPRLYYRLEEPEIPGGIFDGLATFLERAGFR